MANESIYIGNKEIPCLYQKMDINQLKFHHDNPRIASILFKNKGNNGEVTEEKIDSILWDNNNNTHQLKRNIEDNGGLQNPIIVYKNEVLEGNTRLCCYRHLYNEFKIDKWKYIDCKILLGDVTPKEVNALLGNEHIIGKIKWETYEKGYWMTMMLERDHYSWEELEKIVGQCRAWIQNHIDAYKIMIRENVEDTSKFSHFVQLVSNGEIKKIESTTDPEIKEKIIGAIKNGQFQDAKDIRKIPTILKDKKAKKRLFEYGEDCQQVYHELKSDKPTIDSPFIKAVSDITIRVESMKREQRDELSESNQDKAKIRKLTKELIKLCRELDIDINLPKNMR
jgi:hypothetical protein